MCQGTGDLLCKIASAANSKTNVTRNLTVAIHKAGASLQVPIDVVQTTIRFRKPKVRIERVWWPVLPMKSWIPLLMEQFPQVLLGGHMLEQESKWRSLLRFFWGTFQQCDPNHPVFTDGTDLETAIPYMIHGDEGRGLRRQPFMVQAWQLVLSWKGLAKTNTSGPHCLHIILCWALILQSHLKDPKQSRKLTIIK